MNRHTNISVLMTAFNAGQFIGEAIRSVLAQSLGDFEFIIIDDGSSDGTLRIIRSFTDPRIRCLTQENRGIAAALNRGMSEARGEYIARFDADDICYPHWLETQYGLIKNSPDHVIIGSSADYIDQDGEFVFTSSPPAFTNQEIQAVKEKVCPFIHSGVLFRKETVQRKGGYNEHAHSFEDHLLWLSILEEGKAVNIPQPLIKVRLNPGSITIDEQWRPRQFHRIKIRALHRRFISADDGRQLLKILRGQNTRKIKEGAYYSLLAKKFLWNNYQPAKARKNLKIVMGRNRLHWKSYCFYLLSFLPQPVLQRGYKLFKSPDYPGNYQKK